MAGAVTISIIGTNDLHGALERLPILGGYLANGWYDIDFAAGTAPLVERFPIQYWDGTEDFKKTTPSVAKFYTKHFSGYTLASGIRGVPLIAR